MAAGRGEFFRSFMEGLKRQPARQAPEIKQPNHVRGRPRPGERFPGHGRGTSSHRSKERPAATRSSGSGNEARCFFPPVWF